MHCFAYNYHIVNWKYLLANLSGAIFHIICTPGVGILNHYYRYLYIGINTTVNFGTIYRCLKILHGHKCLLYTKKKNEVDFSTHCIFILCDV